MIVNILNNSEGVLNMAFLSGLGDKVSKAAQAAAKKSNELLEITKINMSISGEEEKIQKIYKQIGELVFDDFKNNTDRGEDIVALCQEVVSHQQAISDLKEKLMSVKNMKICSGCGAELERAVTFCPKCGTKQEALETPIEEEPDLPACPSCNAKYDEGTIFCSNCGHKLVE